MVYKGKLVMSDGSIQVVAIKTIKCKLVVSMSFIVKNSVIYYVCILYALSFLTFPTFCIMSVMSTMHLVTIILEH